MTDLVLAGARVLAPAEAPAGTWVAVAGERIEAVGTGAPPPAASSVDLAGAVLSPGFLDLHVHGGGGTDVMRGDAEAVAEVAAFHLRHGTTGLLATTLAAAPAELEQVVAAIAAARAAAPGVLGAHLEGPWLSAARRGAQPAEHLRDPDPAELAALLAAGAGAVRMIALAPELPGALGAIEAIAGAGAVPALAHTDATWAQATAAIAAGADHALHLFNGMRPLHHREPGVVGALLEAPGVTCELIADGHHVHPAALRLAHRLKGAAGTVLVTDAMAAAGLPDGPARLGPAPVTVRGGRVETADGRLAGSTLTMDAAVRNARRWLGVPLAEAVELATLTPARVLGMEARKGRIAPGADADLVVLDGGLRVLRVMSGGRWAS